MPETTPPTILAFDTAGAALSIAICQGHRALAAMHLPMQRGHVELLLPSVQQVLAAARMRLRDLDALATTVGPGSFTGLRTGLSAAQGLAYGGGLPLVGIDRFTALAASLRNREGRPIAVAFDSKARSLYVQAFDTALVPLSGWAAEGCNLTAEEAVQALTGIDALLAGDGVPALLAAGLPGRDTGARAVTAPMVAAAAMRELSHGNTGWPPYPLYLAPPRAKLPKDGGRLRARLD
jgi:tRNA threonylcarbamoyl adenosine modification protein YeaZ